MIILGIDPSLYNTGACYQIINDDFESSLSIWSGNAICTSTIFDEMIADHEKMCGQTIKIYAMIEASKSCMREFLTAKNIANACKVYIKDLFPRRNKVEIINPMTWRKELYGNGRPENSKLEALRWCSNNINYRPDNDDVAEAICVMHVMKNRLKKKGIV